MRLVWQGAGLIVCFRQGDLRRRLKVLAKNFLRHILFGRIWRAETQAHCRSSKLALMCA